MGWSDLEAFVHFSETLNFTRSAEALSISQPALHQKIQKLSSDLGIELYRKDGRRLTLTPSGEDLARFARQTLAQYEAFQKRVATRSEAPVVTLMAGAGAYRYLLGPAIVRFRAQEPAQLRLLTGSRQETLEAVRTGRAQLGVTVLSEPDSGFHCSRIHSAPAMLVVPRGGRWESHKQARLSDLEGESIICPPAPSPLRETIGLMLRMHNVAWHVGVEASGWDLMMHFVSLGLGTAIVNGCCGVPEGCRALPLPEFLGSDYYLVRPLHAWSGDAEALLCEAIEQTVAQRSMDLPS